MFSNIHSRAAGQCAPILSGIPARSAHTHAKHHSHAAPSAPAPLAQPQEWRVAAPTTPPFLQPKTFTAGPGVWGRPRRPCSFSLGLPQRSLRAFSRGESGEIFPAYYGSPIALGVAQESQLDACTRPESPRVLRGAIKSGTMVLRNLVFMRQRTCPPLSRLTATALPLTGASLCALMMLDFYVARGFRSCGSDQRATKRVEDPGRPWILRQHTFEIS